jgi:hypothetical protein
MGLKRAMPHAHNYDIEKYKHVYIELQRQGWNAIANASDQADIAAEDAVISAGAGSPSFGEVSSFKVTGLHIDAAGDDIGHLWIIPYDCDVQSDIEFRVWWSSGSSTTTDGVVWKVLYTEITPDGEALAAGATALSTAIASDTVLGANYLQASPWGVLNGGTLTVGRAVSLVVELDSTDVTLGSEATYGYILEIRYVRRAL